MEKKAKKERAKNKPKEPKTKMKLACDRLDKLLEAEGRGAAAKLAAALGVSSQAVTAYRYGTTDASLDTIIAMADYYGKSVDWFLGRTHESNWSADQTVKEISTYTGLSSDAVEQLHEWVHTSTKEQLDTLLPGVVSNLIANGANVLKCLRDYIIKASFIDKFHYQIIVTERSKDRDYYDDTTFDKPVIESFRMPPQAYLNTNKLLLMDSIDDFVDQEVKNMNDTRGDKDGKH